MKAEKEENKMFIPIKKLNFETNFDEYTLIPSLSIKVIENIFAFVCYSDERMITYIKFISFIKNELTIIDEYKLDVKIIEDSPYNIKQIKVENDILIIICRRYLIVEKFEIKSDNSFLFKNILKHEFEENLYKILCENKVMSYEGNILRIYFFSPGKIKLLFNKKLNYILFPHKQFTSEIRQIFEGVSPYDRLCQAIEIEERNEIIFSFCRLLTFGENDIDYTWCDYTIVIMNSKNFQIKTILTDNMIEAENLFYFGNNIFLLLD